MVTLSGNSSNESCKRINVVVVYIPPNGNSKSGKEQLIGYCDSIADNLSSELIILGDLNWDISKEKNLSSKIVLEIEGALGVDQIICCPTRVTIHTESIIDLILTNISNLAHCGA